MWLGVFDSSLFFAIHEDVTGWKVLREKLGVKCLLVADRCLASTRHTSSVDAEKVEERSQSGTSVECGIPPVSPLPVHVAHLSCASLSPTHLTIAKFFSHEAELRGEPLHALHAPIVWTTLGCKHSNLLLPCESIQSCCDHTQFPVNSDSNMRCST